VNTVDEVLLRAIGNGLTLRVDEGGRIVVDIPPGSSLTEELRHAIQAQRAGIVELLEAHKFARVFEEGTPRRHAQKVPLVPDVPNDPAWRPPLGPTAVVPERYRHWVPR
jgi:hypothetical protein